MLLVHGLALSMGFFEFLLSIPLGIAAFAAIRQGRARLAGLLFFLSVLAHPFTVMALVPAVAAVAWMGKRPYTLLAPIPALAVVAFTILSHRSTGAQPTVWSPWSYGVESLAFDGFSGLAATGWIGLVGVLAVAVPGVWRARRDREARVFLLIAVSYGAAAVFAPSAAFDWALLQHRFVPFFWIFLLLVAAAGRLPRWLPVVPVVALCLQCALASGAQATVAEGIEDYVVGARAVPRGARLLPLVFDPRGESPHFLVRPYLHAWAWVLIERGGMTPYVFATGPIHRFLFKQRPLAPPEMLDQFFDCERHGIAANSPACIDFQHRCLAECANAATDYDAVMTWRAPIALSSLLEARGFRRTYRGRHSSIWTR